ncbi:antitoxin Xre-like helix-turn-helix domain-containing protein [Salinibacter ruber]|jgi:putative toxin-antitoxin system antitoxin component (TIGR02293 family)|uniref:antitoxin Xre-like helix-turn-helix domain-containing protein n=1 Tax=Salinibacter ruber TaxID=146919 RepID=UPI002073B007|nr:antitoxin Xre-like helix-turn-helix domain-containing protein [Salinibacter ruber]
MTPSARTLLPGTGVRSGSRRPGWGATAALDRLQSHLQVSDARPAPVLGVSPRTLHRRRTAGPLTPHESDRLVCLAEVVARAHRALNSAESARQ